MPDEQKLLWQSWASSLQVTLEEVNQTINCVPDNKQGINIWGMRFSFPLTCHECDCLWVGRLLLTFDLGKNHVGLFLDCAEVASYKLIDPTCLDNPHVPKDLANFKRSWRTFLTGIADGHFLCWLLVLNKIEAEMIQWKFSRQITSCNDNNDQNVSCVVPTTVKVATHEHATFQHLICHDSTNWFLSRCRSSCCVLQKLNRLKSCNVMTSVLKLASCYGSWLAHHSADLCRNLAAHWPTWTTWPAAG